MIFDNIKRLCEKNGISIYELERSADIGNGTIGKWKDPDRTPNLASLNAISKVLNVDVADLLKEEQAR